MKTPVIDLLGSIEGMEDPHVDSLTQRLEQKVAQNPADERSLLLLGNAYYLQGRIAQGIETFQKAVALRPDNAYAHYYIGISHYRRAEIEEAIAALTKVVSLAPGMVMAYYWLGITCFHAGRYEEARAAYESLLQKNTESHVAHYHAAVICLTMRDHDGARKHLEALVNIGSRDPQVYHKLGRAYWMLNKPNEAAAAYRQGLALNPDNAPLKEALAELVDVQEP